MSNTAEIQILDEVWLNTKGSSNIAIEKVSEQLNILKSINWNLLPIDQCLKGIASQMINKLSSIVAFSCGSLTIMILMN